MRRLRLPGPEEFPSWSDAVERYLRNAVWVFLALLLLVQGAMQVPGIRSMLSPTDRLEGVSYEQGTGR